MQIRVCKHLVKDPTKSVGTVDYRPFALQGAREPIRFSMCEDCLRRAEAFLMVDISAPLTRSSFPPDPPTADDKTKPKGSR